MVPPCIWPKRHGYLRLFHPYQRSYNLTYCYRNDPIEKTRGISFLGYSVGYTLDAVGAAGVCIFSRLTREIMRKMFNKTCEESW